MLDKLEKILFFIFLILIPFQLRIFLRNPVNEWNSIFIYLGDIVFFLVFLLFLNRIKKKRIHISKRNLLLLVFVIIAFISIFISSATKISVFRWVKLMEFIILYIYIASNLKFQSSNFKLNNGFLTKTLLIIVCLGVFQSILAILQFIKQHSIGIKFIEAGIFSPDSPGVANFTLNGERILRSYGSFTHPNVLAGFLLLSIFAFYYLFLRRDIRGKLKGLVIVSCFLVIIFGLFLTFSRTAIAVFAVMTMIMFLLEFFKLRKLEHNEERLQKSKKLIKLFSLVIVSCLLVIVILFPYLKARFFMITIQEQAVDLRFFYNKIALSIIKEKPILGIGIGNFVHYSQNYQTFLRAASKMAGNSANEIPDWIYQPEHNVYLLIASEIGILGLLMFMAILITNSIRMIRRINPLVILFVGFLIIALTDHYFWTLQQGGMMFWLALALAKTE